MRHTDLVNTVASLLDSFSGEEIRHALEAAEAARAVMNPPLRRGPSPFLLYWGDLTSAALAAGETAPTYGEARAAWCVQMRLDFAPVCEVRQ